MKPNWADDFPLTYAGYQYARDVADGNINVCRYVRWTCERHIEEFDSGVEGYEFDAAKSERACRFIQLLPHVKGQWARRKQLLTLSPFQLFIVSSIFGWVNLDGFRRYREVYIELPRKNGKSALAAAIGLYMFAADGEPGAEVYSGAQSEKQALMVFTPARLMAKQTLEFLDTFGVEVHAKNLSIPGDSSKFEPLIGDPGDGASPSCAIIDEFHEAKTPELYNTMVTGMGAREQPLTLIITTAGNNRAGPCYEKRLEMIKSIDGTMENPDLFCLIYTLDDGDDWTDEELLEKSNPNIGVSVSREYLETRLRAACATASKQNVYKTKHHNIWVGAHSAWMDMIAWDRSPERRPLDDLRDRIGYIGLDLASKIDVAALVLVFPPEKDDPLWHVFGKYYIPEETVEEHRLDTHSHYDGWHRQGLVTLTEGNIIDLDVIEEDIVALCRTHTIGGIGYDPMQATQLVTHLQKQRLPAVEVPQQVRHLSEPMKQTEALVIDGKLAHGRCPVLTWMTSNVVAKLDAKENTFPRKEVVENKIDGAVALIMAIARAMAGPVKHQSVYDREGRGFRSL